MRVREVVAMQDVAVLLNLRFRCFEFTIVFSGQSGPRAVSRMARALGGVSVAAHAFCCHCRL